MGPISLPFHWTFRPPALPTVMRAISSPETVFVWSGSNTPLKICLPPLLIESHVASLAERFSSRRLTPSAPVVVVTFTTGSLGTDAAAVTGAGAGAAGAGCLHQA